MCHRTGMVIVVAVTVAAADRLPLH